MSSIRWDVRGGKFINIKSRLESPGEWDREGGREALHSKFSFCLGWWKKFWKSQGQWLLTIANLIIVSELNSTIYVVWSYCMFKTLRIVPGGVLLQWLKKKKTFWANSIGEMTADLWGRGWGRLGWLSWTPPCLIPGSSALHPERDPRHSPF